MVFLITVKELWGFVRTAKEEWHSQYVISWVQISCLISFYVKCVHLAEGEFVRLLHQQIAPPSPHWTVWKGTYPALRGDSGTTCLKAEQPHKWSYPSAFYLFPQVSAESGISVHSMATVNCYMQRTPWQKSPSFSLSLKQAINYSSLSSPWKFTVPLLLLLMCYFCF